MHTQNGRESKRLLSKTKNRCNAAQDLLYGCAVSSTRGGPLFNAFPYPTKVSPEAIALFIAVHTKPGETVFDGFAGSGSTGLAAILCATPTDWMRNEASRLGLDVKWGPRRAILYELSVLGSFVADVLCNPPDPHEFSQAAERLLQEVRTRCSWLYASVDPDGNVGESRYVIWTEILRCPECRKQVTLWDGCVSREPAQISSTFECTSCGSRTQLADVPRVRETTPDPVLAGKRLTRKRRQAWVYGQTDGRLWSRAADQRDHRQFTDLLRNTSAVDVPNLDVPWGDLHRSGYHDGITHLHHFYTHRNLHAFAELWKATLQFPVRLRRALQFWLLSYNASHSTLMTRVVAKKGQRDLVLTSAQPGVLYISGLPVEKNIFLGLSRKARTITSAFAIVHGNASGLVAVHNASCLDLELPDRSVDYVFTDPPFGGNIPYSEINFLNEAWLGQLTDTTDEAIVNSSQKKSLAEYRTMLRKAFQEMHRVLKDDGAATVAFHSASAAVWNALRDACEEGGMHIANTSVLNKTQDSFKQVRTRGAVKGDPLILLKKSPSRIPHIEGDVWAVTDLLIERASVGDPIENTPQRLYSRLVGYYLSAGQQVPLDADEFYRDISRRNSNNGGHAD